MLPCATPAYHHYQCIFVSFFLAGILSLAGYEQQNKPFE